VLVRGTRRPVVLVGPWVTSMLTRGTHRSVLLFAVFVERDVQPLVSSYSFCYHRLTSKCSCSENMYDVVSGGWVKEGVTVIGVWCYLQIGTRVNRWRGWCRWLEVEEVTGQKEEREGKEKDYIQQQVPTYSLQYGHWCSQKEQEVFCESLQFTWDHLFILV
jgi:hypothetical protein